MSLLLSIARCEVLRGHLARGAAASHPCSRIVAWQAEHGIVPQQVPEPWNGDLARAPLLFVSSNPTIGAHERYPTLEWPDEAIVRFFERRFGPDPDAPIAHGTRVLLNDGRRGRANPFLSWVRARAAELGHGEPGTGYALTEVVHCKSSSEAAGGVGEATAECLERYGRSVLQASGARAWVFVGAHAARGARTLLGLDPHDAVHGPLPLLGRERMVVFMPHPNARTARKTFAGRLSADERGRLVDWVGATGPG